MLCLATSDELSNISDPPTFLHFSRMKFTRERAKQGEKTGTPASRIEKSKIEGQEPKMFARQARTDKVTRYHQTLVTKLSQPKFRALYVAVARLFADQLIKMLQKIQALKPGGDAGKRAPTPGASHDRVTNFATAISQLIHTSQVISSYPSALNTPISLHDRSAILCSLAPSNFRVSRAAHGL